MTAIAAFVTADVACIAADGLSSHSGHDIQFEDRMPKAFRTVARHVQNGGPEGEFPFLVGVCGAYRVTEELARWTPPTVIEEYDGSVGYLYLRALADGMQELFTSDDRLWEFATAEEDGTRLLDSAIIVAWPGFIGGISGDFSTAAFTDHYAAAGSCVETLYGALYALRDAEPEVAVVEAVNAAIRHHRAIGPPVRMVRVSR